MSDEKKVAPASEEAKTTELSENDLEQVAGGGTAQNIPLDKLKAQNKISQPLSTFGAS